MAKFCMYCGKPLEEGVPCDCKNQEKKEMQSPAQEETASTTAAQSINTQKVGSYFSKLLNTAMAVIKQPVSMGKTVIKTADTALSMGFLGMQALVSAIFAMIIMGKVDSLFSSAADIASIATENDSVKEALKIPYVKIFFITLIASVCLSALLAAILMLVFKIAKKDYTYTMMLNIVAVRSIVMVPVMLAAILVSFIGTTYGIGLFYFANIIGIIAIIYLFPVEDGQKDKATYLLALAMLIFMAVSLLVMSKLYVYYLPDTIRTGMAAYKNAGGLEGIFKSMLGSM